MKESYLAKINDWKTKVLFQSSLRFEKGDVVIVETQEGISPAIVEKKYPQDAEISEGYARVKLIRKANLADLKLIKDHRKKEESVLRIARQEVKSENLPMKIVGASYSFDRGNIVLSFIADSRVDFRELVKKLSKKFQRSVRLHQIGARDESRQGGGYGICGRELCCAKFKGNLPSISSEMAKVQQIFHRGSERISGICGRLMCCLAYEAEQYKEIAKEYPKVGEEISYKGQRAVVKSMSLLSGEVNIELENKTIVTISRDGIK